MERLGQSHKNLKVWRTSDGEMVAAFHKRNITNDTWPAIQFDAAETHLFFTVKDAVVLYNMAGDLTKADRKVKMEVRYALAGQSLVWSEQMGHIVASQSTFKDMHSR